MLGSMFDDTDYEHETLHGILLKFKPKDAGQLDTCMHLTLWPAAEELILHIPSYITPNIQILELGAGSGFVGIHTLRNFPVSLTITDCEPEVLYIQSLDLIQSNLALNSLSCEVSSLFWGSDKLSTSYELILGSDVIYSSHALAPLLTCIKDHLSHSGVCLLANTMIRFQNYQQEFERLCSLMNLRLEYLPSMHNSEVKVGCITFL